MFKPNKLSLSGVTLLVLSAVFILAGKPLVNWAAYLALLNGNFIDVASLNAFTFGASIAGYALMAACAAVFLYLGWTSRFHVDRQRVKGQTRRIKAAFVVAAVLLMVSPTLFAAPVSANSMATTGYYLATPYSPYDWLVGNFSSGLVYAINGSSWANMMTFPTPAPWAAYAGNATAVVEAALTATTAGTIYLKEVAYNYSALDVSANVSIIENVNGLIRTFVNSANSQGSPYTISVGSGADDSYYFCQDSADRYVDSFTSTDYGSLMNTAILAANATGGGVIHTTGTSNCTVTTKIMMNMTRHVSLDFSPNVWLVGSIMPTLEITGLGMDGWNGTAFALPFPSMNDWQINNLHIYYNGPVQSGAVVYVHKTQNDRAFQGAQGITNLVITSSQSLLNTGNYQGIPSNVNFVGLWFQDCLSITVTDPSIAYFGTCFKYNSTTWQGTGNYYSGAHFGCCQYAAWYQSTSTTNEAWKTPYFMRVIQKGFNVDSEKTTDIHLTDFVSNEMSDGTLGTAIYSEAHETIIDGGLIGFSKYGVVIGNTMSIYADKHATVSNVHFFKLGTAIVTGAELTQWGNSFTAPPSVNATIVYNGTSAIVSNPQIVAKGEVLGGSNVTATICSYTPTENGTFEIGGSIKLTSFTSGAATVWVDYTDKNTGNAISTNLLLKKTAIATIVTGANSADHWYGLTMSIEAMSGHKIEISVQGSATPVYAYNAEAWIKQVSWQ